MPCLQGHHRRNQASKQEEQPRGGVRTYDLASQERIVRGRMPTMEIINERFARNIRIGLFNFIRKSPEVAIGGIKVQKYSAFLRDRGADQLQHRRVGRCAARG